MRNELFGRLLYLIVNTCFAKVRKKGIEKSSIRYSGHSSPPTIPPTFIGDQWPPLWFRLGCTSALQHLGGIHSGCATSGLVWLIFKVVLIFIHHRDNHDAVLVMGVLTNLAVVVSILSAFPWVRNTHHKWVRSINLKNASI